MRYTGKKPGRTGWYLAAGVWALLIVLLIAARMGGRPWR